MDNVVNIKRQHKHVGKALEVIYGYTTTAIHDEEYRTDVEYDVAIKLLARFAHQLEDPTEFIADMNAHLIETINSVNNVTN